MLLLVVQAEFDQRRDVVPQLRADIVDQLQHRRGDVVAIGGDRIDGRARQEAALRPRMARPDRLVIGVEQVGEGGVERPVGGVERLQQKGLEKPAGMRQMPFRRADVGHRLDRLILRSEVGGQGFAGAADQFEPGALGPAIVRAQRRLLNGCIEHLGSPVGVCSR